MKNVVVIAQKGEEDYDFEFLFAENLEKLGACYTIPDKKTKDAFIRAFDIEEKYRRKGYGTLCYKVLERLFEKDDIKTMSLISYEEAETFWKKLGFKRRKSSDEMTKTLKSHKDKSG